jgi:peptide/nickel transport system substrate-binding protein
VRIFGIALCLMLATTGCGPAQPSSSLVPAPSGQRGGEPKRIVAAIGGLPKTLNTRINQTSEAGQGEVEALVNTGLSVTDARGLAVPVLAEAIPTVENGLWIVEPDGTMATTWRIRDGARWHDGVAFTPADILFTLTVRQDKQIPSRVDPAFNSIASIETPDDRTVTVHWKRPFIQADVLFNVGTGSGSNTPSFLPKHILEPAYTINKEAFLQLPFWNEEFVGTGPFKVKEWPPGGNLLLDAHEQFVLGRPQIDQIEIRFVPDTNAMLANVLAGAIDMTLGRGLSVDQAVQIRDRWGSGRVDVDVAGWLMIFPQFMNPNPAVVGDVRFRRAATYAIDRQQLADSIQAGLFGVAESFVSPASPEYQDVQASIVRYEYDPRRAAALLDELGYATGPDGGRRDAAGDGLSLEIRTTSENDIHPKSLFAVTYYLQQVGMRVDPVVIPLQRADDREYRSTFPGFFLWRQPAEPANLNRHHSSSTPRPENNYVGNNYARYVNAEWDELIDRYFATIPRQQRTAAVADAVRHQTGNLNLMGLFWDGSVTLISNRLANVAGASATWNAEVWNLASEAR